MSSTSPTAGPYTIVEGKHGWHVENAGVMMPSQIFALYDYGLKAEQMAQEACDALNAAHALGQASREQQWIPVSELQVGERYVVQEAGGHAFVGTYTGGRFEFTMDGSNYVRQVAHSQRITILP